MSEFVQQNALDANWYSLELDGPGLKLSNNFALVEFACRDGSDNVAIHPQLVKLLQKARDDIGEPIRVLSGFRTKRHNVSIGGEERSRHLYGMAVDIVIKNVEPVEAAEYFDRIGVGGLGRYKTFTHVDVQGLDRRW